MSYDKWREKTKYGRRWKSEVTFSDFKALISELIAAVTDQGIVKEVVSKVTGFNFYKSVRAEIVGTTCNGVTIHNPEV
jgi:hypothetical protein